MKIGKTMKLDLGPPGLQNFIVHEFSLFSQKSHFQTALVGVYLTAYSRDELLFGRSGIEFTTR